VLRSQLLELRLACALCLLPFQQLHRALPKGALHYRKNNTSRLRTGAAAG
jgi:hypothetical protein